VRHPGAVHDPDTGAWISNAEVAEVPYTTLRHDVAVLRRTTAKISWLDPPCDYHYQ